VAYELGVMSGKGAGMTGTRKTGHLHPTALLPSPHTQYHSIAAGKSSLGACSITMARNIRAIGDRLLLLRVITPIWRWRIG
tara:strand:+ start:1011 stop:1253 length:243 start_codon:yes stop_codon:yes gene_type:complete